MLTVAYIIGAIGVHQTLCCVVCCVVVIVVEYASTRWSSVGLSQNLFTHYMKHIRGVKIRCLSRVDLCVMACQLPNLYADCVLVGVHLIE